MRKALFGVIAASSLLLSSCAFHQEAAHNVNNLETSVQLNQKNFKVIGTVTGESEQTYFLGIIGGMSKKTLTQSAMSEMMQNADLKGGARAIINTTVQYKTQGVIFVVKRKAIATGTVIEFTK